MQTASRTRASDPAAPPADRWGRALLAGALLALLAGCVHLLAGSRPPVAPGAALRAEAPRPALPRTRPPVAVPAAAVVPPTLPASLRGTREDGALRVDGAGDLVIAPEVLRFFDYYLSATGEESAATLRGRIVAAIHRRLPDERPAVQAVALLDAYLDYREASRGLRVDGDDPAARLDALRALRRRSFGTAVAEALFGDEERALAVAIEQRKLLADAALSRGERERRLSDLEARLPDRVREARAEATRPLRERAEEDALRAGGASDDDLHDYRAATVGEAAADRLAALDSARAAWSARLTAFREARAAILASEPDPSQQQAAVQQLLAASFTTLEQIRVRAADQMNAP
jgi:lipase chaperone LimK